MAVDVSALDTHLPQAVRQFWRARRTAAKSQRKRGTADQGNRSGVTAGKNMNGFVSLVKRIIVDNGVPKDQVFSQGRNVLTIPGFYRPTKNWDLLVVRGKQLIAAVEFKSQVGPSFGNNFNNRVEEAVGNAADLNTAFREGAFGECSKPFVGYFFVLEDCDGSTQPVRFSSPHFSAMPEFHQTSYAARYEILCRKLVQEQMYDAAALVLTRSSSSRTGDSRSLSDLTSAKRFAATLGGRIAAILA